VFFGTSEFAVPALRAFAERVSCALVVTQPDRPAGRGHKVQSTPVKVAARELGIPTVEPERLRDIVVVLAAVHADVFAVASYGKIVPQAILDLPRLGALNVHPSLLPLYRGATPLQSQLRDGVVDGGVSIIVMDAGMDTGDVVLAERSAIGLHETYGQLHDRYAALGADLLARALSDIASGRHRHVSQTLLGSEAEAARTLTRPLTKTDLEIDWQAPARAVVDRIRSLSPAPGARAQFAGDDAPVKILAARVLEPQDLRGNVDSARLGSLEPGSFSGGFVATGSGFVVLEKIVPAGRGAMTGEAYARSRGERIKRDMVSTS
jgi:methionyl-tRNA formyltransferase